MDADELSYWIAFYRLHGYPEDRLEFMVAQLTALVRNAIGQKGRPAQPSDFLLDEVLKTAEERETEMMLKYFDQMSTKNAKP